MEQESEVEIRGLPVSLGIEVGPAYILEEDGFHFPIHKISEDQVPGELERLERAWKQTIQQIEKTLKSQDDGERQLMDEILELHLMLAKDLPKHTRAQTKRLIEEEHYHAETAFHYSLQDLLRRLGQHPLQRSEDVAAIGNQVIRNIVGKEVSHFEDIDEPVVLIAEDLSPSITAQLPKDKVLGFATAQGSRTSHTAIMARALEIPAVVSLPNLLENVHEGDKVIVDGDRGRVVIRPTPETLERYEKRREIVLQRIAAQLRYRELEAETLDGFTVNLLANIELPEEVDTVLSHGGKGIGLYRSEFLFLNRIDLPSEEEQLDAYETVAKTLAPKPVIIRTLDIGGDKFLSSVETPKEMNPFMGRRGLRFCLEQPEIFHIQLRAILRASVYGNLSLMFPMISEVRELRLAVAAVETAKADLRKEGLPFNEDIRVGAMIEVPSAALVMKGMAPLVDFFSIGTNDLIQYTLAVDRSNQQTAGLYNPLNPGVLRLIKEVVDSAHAAGKKVCMCGEMAGELAFTLVLVGMMVDELSMSPIAIPEIKKLIRSISLVDVVPIAEAALQMTEAVEIQDFLEKKTFELAPWTSEILSTETLSLAS